MKKRIFTTISLVCCLVICFAAIADVSGKWTGSIKTPDGNDATLIYTTKVDGDKITGTVQQQGEGEAAKIDSGKVAGKDISLALLTRMAWLSRTTGNFTATR